MELVYLWVEDYKNIKKQGFNFSSKFNCDYDEDKNELTIKESDDYIENFFGNNINVTAIVGKNGSGKSSVLKLIFLLLFCKNYDMEDNPIYHESIIEAIRLFTNKELFLILWDGKKHQKISMKFFIRSLVDKKDFSNIIELNPKPLNIEKVLRRTDKEIKACTLTYDEIEKGEMKTFFIHFNYMLDTLYDGEQDKWIKEIYHKADSYMVPLLLEPYKNNENKQIINLEIIEYLNNQNLLRFYKKLSSNKNITNFFNPNRIKYYNPMFDFPHDMGDEDFKCLEKSSFKGISWKFWQIIKNEQVFIDIKEFDDNFCKIMNQIGKWYEDQDYKNINLLYIALKVLTSSKELFNQKEYSKYKLWLLNLQLKQYDITAPEIDLDNLIQQDTANYEVRKIQTCISFNKKYPIEIFIEYLSKEVDIHTIKTILDIIPPWVNVEFYENEKSMSSLSSGEKNFLYFFNKLNISSSKFK